MSGSTGRIKSAVLIVLLIAGYLANAGVAEPAEPDSTVVAHPDSGSLGVVLPDSGSTVAFVLAFAGRPLGVVPVTVSRLRETASDQLTTTLTARGFEVLPQDTVLSLMTEWRVRDGKSIPRGFLDSLADSMGVDLLLVANVIVGPGWIVMTGRYMNPGPAVLMKVTIRELAVPGSSDVGSGEEGIEWLDGIRSLSSTVAEVEFGEPRVRRGHLLMLDTQPVGCSASDALIADHALLEHYVEYGDLGLIDPALVRATLGAAGHSEKYLGRDARTLLQNTFATRGLVVPGLASYDQVTTPRGRFFEEDQTLDQLESGLRDFSMILRLVDLADGSITDGSEEFLIASNRVGWFGVIKNETTLMRLKVSVAKLWFALDDALEEF
jgi:hypothetical protein